MTKQNYSSSKSNPMLEELRRESSELDISWLHRAYTQLKCKTNKQWSYILLMGSRDIAAFRIRNAQAYLRAGGYPEFCVNGVCING